MIFSALVLCKIMILSMSCRYLGSDGEDPEEAAIRIYNLYPSGASALDGDQEE